MRVVADTLMVVDVAVVDVVVVDVVLVDMIDDYVRFGTYHHPELNQS